jgi:hypothetical protein
MGCRLLPGTHELDDNTSTKGPAAPQVISFAIAPCPCLSLATSANCTSVDAFRILSIWTRIRRNLRAVIAFLSPMHYCPLFEPDCGQLCLQFMYALSTSATPGSWPTASAPERSSGRTVSCSNLRLRLDGDHPMYGILKGPQGYLAWAQLGAK